MHSYYAGKLAAGRLKLCYDLAPPSVNRYLAAEIDQVSDKAASAARVLELGCGYGRVLREISHTDGEFFGIDTSLASLSMASSYFEKYETATLAKMDAVQLGFQSETFDLVYCIQNGISAFHVDQQRLLSEAVRVTKSGGRVMKYKPVLFIAFVHFVVSRILFVWMVGRATSRFDTDLPPTVAENTAGLISQILDLPISLLHHVVSFSRLPGFAEHVTFAVNSLIWGFAIWFLLKRLLNNKQ